MTRLGQSKYGVLYRLPDGRINPEYSKKRNAANRPRTRLLVMANYRYNREANLQRSRKWYREHKDRHYEAVKKWIKEHPERAREISHKRWVEHPDEFYGKIKQYREAHPERVKVWRKRANAKHHAKRERGLPTRIVLGKPFENSHLHHLTPDLAIFIPEDIHKSISHNIWTGKNMAEINARAWEFYEPKGMIFPI